MSSILYLLVLKFCFILLPPLQSSTAGFLPTDGESKPQDKPVFDFNLDWNQDAAELRPSDALVFIGETLTMYCIILDAAGDVHAPAISLVLTPKVGQPWTIEDLVIVDDKTAYKNITISESFQQHTSVNCVVGTRSLRSTFIYAEKPIQPITKFTGVYNYKKSIEVTWELGQDYLDEFKLGVATDWLPFSSPVNRSRELPCSRSTKLSCTIDASHYNGQDILFFRVQVFSINWSRRPSAEYLERLYPTNVTSVHRFDVLENTKPGPPMNLQVINETSSCFSIAWDNPHYLIYCIYCDKEYELELIDEGNASVKTKDTMDNMAVVNPSAQEVITVCALKANHKYTVSLRVRDKNSLWSDWSMTEARSKEGRPLSGPPVLTTNYYKGECHLNKRKVIVYWTSPDIESVRGNLTRFHLNVDKIYSLPPETRSFKMILTCNNSHNILISSVTRVGLSKMPSEIFVPKDDDELTETEISEFAVLERFNPLVSTSLKNLTVTWDTTYVKDVTLVFYMCQENAETLTCNNDYAFIEVDVNVGKIFLPNVSTTHNLFGFALQQADGKKTAIRWTPCVYQSDAVPSQTTHVRVIPGNKAGTLVITWLATPCSRTTKVYIQKYIVYLCPSNEFTMSAESCPHATVNAKTGSFWAENLHDNSKYTVYIRGAGLEFLGPFSDPTTAVTGSDEQQDSTKCSDKTHITGKQMDDENQDNKNIYIGLISTLVLILLIIIISIICWKCRRD